MADTPSPSPFLDYLLQSAGYDRPEDLNEFREGISEASQSGETYHKGFETSTKPYFFENTEPTPLSQTLQRLKQEHVPARTIAGLLYSLSQRLRSLGQFPTLQLRASNIRQLAGFEKPHSYDDIHKGAESYRFLTEEQPNELLSFLHQQGYFDGASIYVDSGCGNGRDVFAARHQAAVDQCFGNDTSPAAISKAKKRAIERRCNGHMHFVRGEVYEVLTCHPYLEQAVDIVTFDSVLHLLTDPKARQTVRFVRDRLLSPDGVLAIAQKTPKCTINSITGGAILLERTDNSVTRMCHDGLVRRFDDKDRLVEWIESLGLKIKHHEKRRLKYASEQPDEFAWVISGKR